MNRYDRAVRQIVDSHDRLIESMEKESVQLALEISKAIIHREVMLDEHLICGLVETAM
jgi:flagellar biosynthesis/type III secretory pathway protein FliH